ncbi:large conductance mechanosensitive channel protein MscL [Gudongella oleilytica]|jgi:large conductance mechanosensitive channel|uniref:large conductance mechanosensitive channel protein MscL n=1 Tax=Gudongella oleilytica TaxID=1582259 RepID=UPI002A364CE7|nr:large conductance mechanosensitive channel protein MscL [Gudongella oleilytica]MDY0256143.1 large conductance mechanosensitive channel protein MscL [Gudongella oleilytica]
MFQEFKKFAMRGNVIDLAVGVVIGGAFGKIVASLVADIIMPLVSLAVGGMDFAGKFVSLDGNTYPTLAAAQEAGAATINYGLFIMAIIDFLIIAFSIFMVVRAINRMKKPEEPVAEEPTTKECPFCKSQVAIAATRCPHCTSSLE